MMKFFCENNQFCHFAFHLIISQEEKKVKNRQFFVLKFVNGFFSYIVFFIGTQKVPPRSPIQSGTKMCRKD
jgi:hypothetical protein